jgi:hypothetical protein
LQIILPASCQATHDDNKLHHLHSQPIRKYAAAAA